MAKKVNGKGVKIFEIVFYSICGAVALWGLTYIVLGLIANYADVPDNKNYVLQASENLREMFKLGFYEWGLIIFSIGMGLGILVLIIIANTVDKTNEKAARRAARLAKIEAEMNAASEAEAQ